MTDGETESDRAGGAIPNRRSWARHLPTTELMNAKKSRITARSSGQCCEPVKRNSSCGELRRSD